MAIRFSILVLSFMVIGGGLAERFLEASSGLCENEGCECNPCQCNPCNCFSSPLPNYVYIGPEVYNACRKREGGTRQDGCIAGVRIGYEHVKRYRLYWGIEGLYASGRLSGHGGNDTHLKSDLTDAMVEGRFGYTIASKCAYRPSFTPYVGGGYFSERNDYKHPSPIHVHLKTEYSYIAYGFLSHVFPIPWWELGLNVKCRAPLNTQCKISNDPEFDNFTLGVENMTQYRIELPNTYHPCPGERKLTFSVTPFYEYRVYGRQNNFPFDFLKTEFNIWGANVLLLYFF